jgi:hypothetical protein
MPAGANTGCCPPTCGCCPGLGLPYTLEVEIGNFENAGTDLSNPDCVTGCDNCALLNGLWYPELTSYAPDPENTEGRYFVWCYYHHSQYLDLNCDEGLDDDEVAWFPGCSTPTSMDLWVALSCGFDEAAFSIQMWLVENSPDSPNGDGSPTDCVGPCTGGWSLGLEITDVCETLDTFCQMFVDGIVLGDDPPIYLTCSGTSACLPAYQFGVGNPCSDHAGDEDYRLYVKVRRYDDG